MQLIAAVVLGIVQGLTEFLPVSSTAHLVLFPWAFGWEDPLINSLTFDVALHLGTLAAVVWYFRRDWAGLIAAFVRSVTRFRISGPEERLAWLVVAATVPAAVLGYLFEDYVETVLRGPLVIAGALAFVAALMLAAERAAKGVEGARMESMGLGHALAIGLAQASALIPGVSRSGATITAGLFAGYRRDAAARFSFILSTPVIAGACVLKLGTLAGGMPEAEAASYAAGAAAAAVSGYAAIAFLMRFLQKHPLNVFAYYRFLLAGAVVASYLAR